MKKALMGLAAVALTLSSTTAVFAAEQDANATPETTKTKKHAHKGKHKAHAHKGSKGKQQVEQKGQDGKNE